MHLADTGRINRNIVECKVYTASGAVSPAARINRNIVECKATCRCGCTAAPLRINKNIVECKALKLAKDMIELRVLIETLWNVKLDISFEVFFQVVRINRNIVECKAG